MADAPPSNAPPHGRIDIHSHLLPGIDDGCRDVNESILCIKRLIEMGYVGTICTPHIWHDMFPDNTAENIRHWAAALQKEIDADGLPYRVWPGGEVRIFDGYEKYWDKREIPTLANSRCVLLDFWAEKWPKWAEGAFAFLRGRGYQPILAHPERMRCSGDYVGCLTGLADKGVWLQGNFRCMTGEEGYHADQLVRLLATEGRYKFMALDMHRHETLEGRLDGLALFEAEFGRETLDAMTIDAPRRLIFGI